MNVIRHSEAGFAATLESVVQGSSLFDPEIERRTRDIISAVADRGDAALCELTKRFDGAALDASQLPVTQAEIFAAAVQASPELRRTLAFATRNIERFSRKSLRRGWQARNAQGARIGEKFDPFDRVGIYIPGGTAPLVSTALMTILLARVAGCPQIVVCTPCNSGGAINPALLFAAHLAGATEIYRVGGAQAVAAMALGTQTIAQVQKVFGPGNAYVVNAKRLLVGRVAIDLLPGPSEVLVLADDSATPAHVAADLLAQAEHGSGHERVWCVTTSGRLLGAVQREIHRQLPSLPRREFIERVLASNGWLIQVRTLADGIQLVNRLAPEHCEVMTRRPSQVAAGIRNAGALFLGPWSPTVLGDYVAGPSHTLPTGGAGRCFAGLTVDQFQRRTSIVEYTRPALQKSLAAVEALARLEGLEAHGRSASLRLSPPTKSKS
jgi:histidinol dehydrogenase